MHLADMAVCKATVQLINKYETREMLLIAMHHEAINYQKEKHCTSQTYTRDESKCEIQASLKCPDDGQFPHFIL